MFTQCCESKYIEVGSGSTSGSGSRVMLSILKEKNCKIILEKNKFLYKSKFFKIKMSPKEIFSQLSHWIVNLQYRYTPFVSILSYFYMCGSGSTKLLNTDSQHWFDLWLFSAVEPLWDRRIKIFLILNKVFAELFKLFKVNPVSRTPQSHWTKFSGPAVCCLRTHSFLKIFLIKVLLKNSAKT